MIELVVFDVAGTTVHDGDAVSSCFRTALASAQIAAEARAVSAVMGYPKPEAIRRLIALSGRTLDEKHIDAIHEDFVRRMLHYYVSDPAVREVPGAAATFAALRGAGMKVAVNTGFNRTILQAVLDRLGWNATVIDASVASDEVPRGRPHPDMIHLLMSRLGVREASKVAKVGDTAVDLEEGTNARCGLVIGVTSGTFARAQLESSPHSHILESVAEVPRLVFA